MGETGTKLCNDYMSYATSVLGDWNRVQLSPSPETLTINAKDITLNVDSDTNPFVGGTISIPLNIDKADKVDMDWIKKTFLNIKENKKMEILDLYTKRKIQSINKEYNQQREKILNEDDIQSIIIEMTDQVNAMAENEGINSRLIIHRSEFITNETKEKLLNLDKEKDEKQDKLYDSIREVEAMFDMTEDYTERMKILKKYGIINKDGRLNV